MSDGEVFLRGVEFGAGWWLALRAGDALIALGAPVRRWRERRAAARARLVSTLKERAAAPVMRP